MNKTQHNTITLILFTKEKNFSLVVTRKFQTMKWPPSKAKLDGLFLHIFTLSHKPQYEVDDTHLDSCDPFSPTLYTKSF